MEKNIVLIGFTSCGKSAVGKQVATEIGYRFLDLDKEIEDLFLAENGIAMSCREIFKNRGRDCFLALETLSLTKLQDVSSMVIATGGGAAINEHNHGILKQLGKLVYLYATPSVLLNRMSEKGFPAYMQQDPSLENLTYHWNKRHPVYSALADVVVDTSEKDVQAITLEVIKVNE